MNISILNTRLSMFFACMFGFVLFISVALTNLAVLGLVLTAPIAWLGFYKSKQSIDSNTKLFLWIIFALCAWDVFTNLIAGNSIDASMKALLHDMRTFGFVILLWPVFANPVVSRVAAASLLMAVLLLASINLALTLVGIVPKGDYFTTRLFPLTHMSHLSHMYGQALVGVVLILTQTWLIMPRLSWRVVVPVLFLLASLFLASSRRTGWLLLAAGAILWLILNANRIKFERFRWWMAITGIGFILAICSTEVVGNRMAEVVDELQRYFAMSPQERSSSVLGSVSIRAQYAITVWETIKQSNPWIGVGSLGFPQAYKAAATTLQVTPEAWATYNWGNPHNEYLYMLATKGIVGLLLYLAVFAQACRVAWEKTDNLQRFGLIIFIYLFMLSVTTNSMMIDMEEGHFALLVLLVFLAPKTIYTPANENAKFT